MSSKTFAIVASAKKLTLGRRPEILFETDSWTEAQEKFEAFSKERTDYVCLMDFQFFGGGIRMEKLEDPNNT